MPDHTQERWAQIFDHVPVALALCAADGSVLALNQELRALLRRPPSRTPDADGDDEATARVPEVDLARLDPLQLPERVAEALARGAPVLFDEVAQADGRSLMGTLVPMTNATGDRTAEPVAVLLVQDATHERRLQRRLLLGERMAAVGQLAAGLAHEINNPVSIAYADLQIARELLSEHQAALPAALQELPELVDECLYGIGRVRDIVRDLRTFTSTEVRSQPGEARLDDIIELALRLTRAEVQRRARLVYDRDLVPLPPVRGDAGRLGQVVLDLLKQAQQNIPAVEVSGPSAYHITVRTRVDRRRGVVELLVADTGPTLSEEVRAHLFDPFAQRRQHVSTSVNNALGMGLALSYEVVRRLGGDIESRAAQGGGNEVLVRLPLFHQGMGAH